MALLVLGCVRNRDDHFQFGSVFIKKITKTGFFLKTETSSNQPVSVRLRYFEKNRFKLGSARFFFGLGSVRFCCSVKPNRTGWFFQNSNRFNWFFFTVLFFWLFLSSFLGLIDFSVFLLTPSLECFLKILNFFI